MKKIKEFLRFQNLNFRDISEHVKVDRRLQVFPSPTFQEISYEHDVVLMCRFAIFGSAVMYFLTLHISYHAT